VDLDGLRRLLAEAMRRSPDEPAESDRWLAPRVHALLRLTRRQAADKRFWAWLATAECADYVRWRFPGKGDEEEDLDRRGTAVKRFMGQDRDNALSRLWWGAELCRAGGDYSPVVEAFVMQDVPNTWFGLNAFHHPAAVQAALRILPKLEGRPINRLASALDHTLTTVQLDVVAPAEPPDLIASEEWRRETADVDDLLDDDLPAGPDEAPPGAAQVDAVERLIRRVAADIGVKL
jgi:hypothetical protein